MTRFPGLFCIATAALSLGACDQTSPLAPAPPPRPLPRVPTLSGFVMDDSGSPVANHEVTLEEFFTGNKQATTSTNADGFYEVRLGATTSGGATTGGPGASFIHAGGGQFEHFYVE